MLPERRARRSIAVFRLTAALALAFATAATASATAIATAPSADSETLVSSAPWWEKVTITLDGEGNPQACRFESSLDPSNAQECDVDRQTTLKHRARSSQEYTKITFERRFSPGEQPKTGVEPGETFLGGQMMALAIDAAGKVKDCKVVATSGSMTPEYGCADAQAEKFQASTGAAAGEAERQGYMTILVYGHHEHMV
jgi:hypothetical protein